MQDVVVLLPGIGGSVLARDGKEIWAPTPGAALRGALSLGGSIQRLRLDADDPAADRVDDVVATRLVPDLHVLPGLGWKIDGYTRIREQLTRRLGLVPGENYLEFPYDWRRDNRVAARQLARAAPAWLARWRERSGNADARLVLIGHSMGGIVSRLYLEQFDGWRDTRTLITFGTPYAGSVNALDFLVHGLGKKWGPFGIDLSGLLRSFTAAYQLLPSYRCLAGADGGWLPLDDPGVDWSDTAVDPARLRAAIGLARELRGQVDRRIAASGPGYDVRPVIGDFQPTRCAARKAGADVQILTERGPGEDGGDGTVPTLSAIPHELLQGWRNAAFAGQRHGSLQNDDAVLDHVGGLLRRREEVDVFPAQRNPVTLVVEDIVADEPLTVRARTTDPGARLLATLAPVGAGEPTRHPLTGTGDGWQQVTLAQVPAGDYRVTVSGDAVRPVTDLVSVVDLAEVARLAEGGP